MSIVKVKAKYQIVIPEELRKRIGLAVGDTLEIEEKDGVLIATPVTVIEKSQAYFWTKDWQEGERQAEQAKRTGQYEEFDDADEAVKWLRS